MNLRFHNNLCRAYENTQRKENKLNAILSVVCDMMGLSHDDVTGTRRPLRYVTARHLYCKLSRELAQATVVEVGRKINRDHSTVSHSTQKADDYMITWPFFKQAYNCLHNRLVEATASDFPEWPFPVHPERDKNQNSESKAEPVTINPMQPPPEVQPINREPNSRNYSYKSIHA